MNENIHELRRVFNDGYAAGFIKAYGLVREAMDLKRELDFEALQKEFDEYMEKWSGK